MNPALDARVPPESPAAVVLATGLGAGAVAGLAVALPLSLRCAEVGAPPVSLMLLAAGSAALALGPLAAAIRLGSPWPRAILALPLGALLATGPLMTFGGLLVTATHHRPLGAVTFAVMAAALVPLSCALAARLLERAGSDSRSAGRWRAALYGAVALAALLVGVRLSRALGDAQVARSVLDVTLALALGAVAARLPVPRGTPSALLGGALWVGLLLASLALGADAGLLRQLDDVAPALAWPLHALV